MGGLSARQVIALAVTVAALAACGDSAHKIGSSVKGARIAVIEEARNIEADKSLSGSAPVLSHKVVNMSWPQTGYDSEHTMPYAELSAHPEILWKRSIGEGSSSDFKLLAHPVIENDSVYTMDSQGLVRATSAQSGEAQWEFDTTPKDSDDKAIGGGVTVDGGVVYAATGFGDVYALDAKTGAVKWRKALLKPLRAAPTLSNNHVYVVSIDNDMNALDAATGEVLWHHAGIAENATLMGAASPAADIDNVIVAYNSGEIFDLRAQNGRASWSYALTGAAQVGALPAIADIRGLPVLDHGRVYAISHSGRMAVIDQRSGERLWEADIGGIDTPIVSGDTLFIYGGDSQLMALARETGRVMWVKSLAKRVDADDKDSDRLVWTGPVLAGDRLWMVNSQGRLASFSSQNGEPIDSIDLGDPVYLSPIVVNRTMYVVTDAGKLVALR